jgi:hypothetical protein
LLFWCDEDQDQGSNHTNFKISATGEFLAIVDYDGLSIIDSIIIPSLMSDESYARANNIGAWFTTITSTPGTSNIITDVKENGVIINEFSISAYPNPFNPSTTIKYTIPSSSVILSEAKNLKDFSSQAPQNHKAFITLKVYDILGREVITLVNKNQKSGNYQVEWNASNTKGKELTSGIYFVNIADDFFNKTIKLLLIR